MQVRFGMYLVSGRHKLDLCMPVVCVGEGRGGGGKMMSRLYLLD